jgi:hypothetical protein
LKPELSKTHTDVLIYRGLLEPSSNTLCIAHSVFRVQECSFGISKSYRLKFLKVDFMLTIIMINLSVPAIFIIFYSIPGAVFVMSTVYHHLLVYLSPLYASIFPVNKIPICTHNILRKVFHTESSPSVPRVEYDTRTLEIPTVLYFVLPSFVSFWIS